jgi:hypothetical protein
MITAAVDAAITALGACATRDAALKNRVVGTEPMRASQDN